jgi:hypothetical protein
LKKRIATFGFLIALGANIALAQPAADSPAGKTQANPPGAETDANRGVPEGAAPEPTEDNTPATAETAPDGSDDSPFDYQASEQISEDLSVSFPIDI